MRRAWYLKDRAVLITCIILVMASILLVLVVLRASLTLVLFVFIIFAAGYTIPFAFDYTKRKAFYKNLITVFENLQQKNLIAEMIRRPDFSEGMVLYDLLKSSNKAMLENIQQYVKRQKEYREYVEMWVHEIKTPIASSKLIVQNNLGDVTSRIYEDLDKIEALVEQALYYARSNTVEKDYLIKKTALRAVVFDVAQKNARLFIENHVSFKTGELDFTVYTDAKWIKFILEQLIINAIKYRREEEPEIAVDAFQTENGVTLTVSDNGIGIPRQETEKVFDKGFTGSNGRRNEASTGMGLYLCKKLIGRLGHGIELESTEGEGTCIQIIFPKNSMTEM